MAKTVVIIIAVFSSWFGLIETRTDMAYQPSDYDNAVYEDSDMSMIDDDDKDSDCTMQVKNESKLFFQGELALSDPHFIHLHLSFDHAKKHWTETNETFMGDHWVWTYRPASGSFTYLSLSIDYGVLSFGMLNHRVLHKSVGIRLTIHKTCNLTLGTPTITRNIGEALKTLNENLGFNGSPISKYSESYYCFLAEAPGIRDTFQYQMALYFTFPINYLNYNCCMTHYNFTTNHYGVKCSDKQLTRFLEINMWPFVLSVILFLYSPVILWQILWWIEQDRIDCGSWQLVEYSNNDPESENEGSFDSDWIYLDGEPPYSISHVIANVWFGLDNTRPTLVSRVKRFMLLLLMPTGLYIQLLTFHYGFSKNEMNELLRHRDPVGFLALLGTSDVDTTKCFAPALGGAGYVLVMYYLIGLVLIVVPSSLKRILIKGLPTELPQCTSPLSLSFGEIHRLSKLHITPDSHSINSFFTNCFVMLFSDAFWIKVWDIQTSRFKIRNRHSGNVNVCKVLLAPFYLILCLVEVLASLVLYAVPFVIFVTIFVRGIRDNLREIKKRMNHYCHGSKVIRKLLLENPFNDIVIVVLITTVILLFSYASIVIFIASFSQVFSMVVFSFIAVIVFPSIAFANLFFFIMCIYHTFRQIRNFGDGYTNLLSDTVSISQDMVGSNTNWGERLNKIIAVHTAVNGPKINGIRINDRWIALDHHFLNAVASSQRQSVKVKCQNDAYGVPRELFDFIVVKYRPVHRQILIIGFRLILIATLMGSTIAVITKFRSDESSEASEMMHVMFVLTVGAIPNLLEKVLMTAGQAASKGINKRCLKRLIVGYWLNKTYQTRQL